MRRVILACAIFLGVLSGAATNSLAKTSPPKKATHTAKIVPAESAGDLVAGNYYIGLNASLQIPGLADNASIIRQTCPHTSSFGWLNGQTVAYSLSVGFTIPTSDGLVVQQPLPLLTISSSASGCSITRVKGVVVPLFVPKRIADETIEVNWHLSHSEKVDPSFAVKMVTFLKDIVGIASGVAGGANPLAAIVSSSATASFNQAATDFNADFPSPTSDDSDTSDWVLSKSSRFVLSSATIKTADGNSFPATLIVSVDKRQSVLAAGSALPKADDFRDIDKTTQPIDFKAGTKDFVQLATDNNVQIKTATVSGWYSACEKTVSWLDRNGLNSVDTAGVFMRELQDDSSQFNNTPELFKKQFVPPAPAPVEPSPDASAVTPDYTAPTPAAAVSASPAQPCPDAAVQSWLKQLWPAFAKPQPDKNRAELTQAIRLFISDAAKAFERSGDAVGQAPDDSADRTKQADLSDVPGQASGDAGNRTGKAAAVSSTFNYYFAKDTTYAERDGPTGGLIAATGADAVSAISKVRLSSFGCYYAPNSVPADFQNVAVGVGPDGNAERYIAYFNVDPKALSPVFVAGPGFITSFAFVKADPADANAREKVSFALQADSSAECKAVRDSFKDFLTSPPAAPQQVSSAATPG